MFMIKDEDGNIWKVWVRELYKNNITSERRLRRTKQRKADYERAKGNQEYANAIENQTILDWCASSGILNKKYRVDNNGNQIR